ncbi:MAG: hypothetical protein CMN29_29900 [Sandaracinus sp.]|nr:hypothetical protein [Sandaracinus sp.]
MRRLPLWLLSALLLALACGDDDDPSDAGADAGAEDAGLDSGTDAGTDAGPTVLVGSSEREACAERDPLRRPFFGDLHVHTRFSFDAAAYDVRTGPADAYRFARGEAIGLPPYDADGRPTRMVQLDRPLDFAAVTDHAELMAATSLCTDPASPAYESRTCQSYRDGNEAVADFGDFFQSIGLAMPRPVTTCRADPSLCAAELADVWAETAEAAEAAYDRTSGCAFTSFVAYEWTGSAGGGGRNIHRNVIFRSATRLARPISFVDAPTPELLWDGLEAGCLESGTDCDLIAIPHNSNISVGEMFVPLFEDETPYDRAFAERRADLEPLMEIYQHKGAAECVSGVADPLASEDELCGFEQVFENLCTGPDDPDEDCIPVCDEMAGSSFLGGCVAPSDLLRGALRTGLSELARVGANPFQLGVIASTDTHGSIAGATEEAGWPGHTGNTDDEIEEALDPPGGITVSVRTSSPGGLAVVWAEENSRPALFDAMRRRETYGTSGTRIVARFFGGWGYGEDSCEATDLVQRGYDGGVPMGGVLPEREGDGAPVFLVSAMADALGAPLQRVQIVKGWFDPESGETFEEVYEVAGSTAGPEGVEPVDLMSCERAEEWDAAGAGQLCGRWVDPGFDPEQPAFWYARVIENPTCRWSQRLCLAEGVDCDTVAEGSPLEACCDGSIPPTIQERAWTSPIWYVP